jgi:hypothetical protein
VRATQCCQQPFRDRRVGAAPARNDDGARALDELEAAIALDADAARGAQRPGLDGGDAKAIPRLAHFGARQAEDLDRHPELEGAQSIVGQRHHQAVRRRAGVGASLGTIFTLIGIRATFAQHEAGVKCADPAASGAIRRRPTMPSPVTSTPPVPPSEAATILRTSWPSRRTARTCRRPLKGGAPDFVLLDVRGRAGLCQGACTRRDQPAASRDSRPERMMAWPHDTLFGRPTALVPIANGADRAALKLSRLGRPVK